MTSWINIVFNDEAGSPAGVWGAQGSLYGVKTIRTNDPERSLRHIFTAFNAARLNISHTPFDGVTFKYTLPDGTRQKRFFTRAEFKKKQQKFMTSI